MRISKVYQVSDSEFIEIIKESFSYSECLRKLGLSTNGGSSTDILKKRIRELECSVEHFQMTKNPNYCKHELEDILVENSSYANISSLKSRILKANLMEYKCAICGIYEWNGRPLSLQLDHINGVHNDHRLENLRFLCPNCHSQTDTYAGKNQKTSV